MKKVKRSTFKMNPVAASIVLALSSQFAVTAAHANAGYGVNTDINGNAIAVPTFYAGSPSGIQPSLDPVTHLPCSAVDASGNAISCGTVDTGTALRKFVDPLPGIYVNGGATGSPVATVPGGVSAAGVAEQDIPLVIPDFWVNQAGVKTADEYYELATVAYRQQMHADLPKNIGNAAGQMANGATTGAMGQTGSLLRGYVQIETPSIVANGLKDAVGNTSEHIALQYPDGTPILDANNNQVYAVHKPVYLGPHIIADRGVAIRIKMTNYLPFGTSIVNGQVVNNGDLPMPVDQTIAGGGPAVDAKGNPINFTQNRAEIHWHGGDTPWISDGTPHQWVAPAGETAAYAAGIGKGASNQNVPDMADPGPGATTYYFPNSLMSSRLMFYHDHTSGLTRLNVYDGVAAGYIVRDPVEQALAAAGTIPDTLLGVGIPLVVQDKIFVPKNIGPNATDSNGASQSQDAKWDLTHWGQYGDLWYPHVYEVNQDPNSIDGTNPVGRWDWGPWFWPVFPATYSLPTGVYGDVTTTPEAFADTAIVNGVAYPTLTVDPVPTRFRILSVPNDRTMNYNWFQAVDANNVICDANNPNPAPEASGVACTETKMVAAAPNATFPISWPTDGRPGGVPDPATAGPDFVQIGNEAGFLPAPAVWHAQPVTYDQNVRSMTVFNILNHGLLLMPAERADAIVDFTKYAGQTLLLVNDAPAPSPGFDTRIDYFTGDGDQTVGGGAYNTARGYGPNTRTVMQVKVNATVSGTAINSIANPGAYSLAGLSTALPVAYAQSQPAPIVPEVAYNNVFGTSDVNTFAQNYTGSASLPTFSWTPTTATGFPAASIQLVSPGTGYTSAPSLTITPAAGDTGSGATAVATIDPVLGQIASVTLTNLGSGYKKAPTVSLSGGNGSGAVVRVLTGGSITVPVINKAIQELFDPVYGRMNATLAVELPYTSNQLATTIPYAYVDAPIDQVDSIKENEIQIWKITHNGVDSHPVHFHLVNVQLINRVDWAGVVKPPEPNEVGWKETIHMNPLEDVLVAVKAAHPITPFGLPRSQRVLDPTQALGASAGLTQIDPLTGSAPTYQTYIPATQAPGGLITMTGAQIAPGMGASIVDNTATAYTNQFTDFDNEYVWHCHILGHEEFDFMRPFVFHPSVYAPDMPTVTAVSATGITWTDPTPAGGEDAAGYPTALNFGTTYTNKAGVAFAGPLSNEKNEVGFVVQESADGKTWKTLGTAIANATSWTGTVDTTKQHQVVAYNGAGVSLPGVVVTGNSNIQVTRNYATATQSTQASINGATVGSYATGMIAVGSTIGAQSGAIPGAATPGTAGCSTTVGSPIAGATACGPDWVPTPTGLAQVLNANGGTTLTWFPVVGAVTYNLAVNGVVTVLPASICTTGTCTTTLSAPANAQITVQAVSSAGFTSALAGLYNGPALAPTALAATTDANATGTIGGELTLSWNNGTTNAVGNVSSFLISWAGATATLYPNANGQLPTGATIKGLTTGTSYAFSVTAQGQLGNSTPVVINAVAP